MDWKETSSPQKRESLPQTQHGTHSMGQLKELDLSWDRTDFKLLTLPDRTAVNIILWQALASVCDPGKGTEYSMIQWR